MRAAALLVLVMGSLAAPGCLVVSLAPLYDSDSIGWDARLVGSWIDQDDNASMEIGRAEWQSYRVHYVHPVETGDLTGYLTAVGEERYLDLMPGRGTDRGSVLVPVHLVLRLRLEDDRLELAPLSYDWFADRVRRRQAIPGLAAALDQKDNALIVSPTAALRVWMRTQPPAGDMFGAAAVFVRKDP